MIKAEPAPLPHQATDCPVSIHTGATVTYSSSFDYCATLGGTFDRDHWSHDQLLMMSRSSITLLSDRGKRYSSVSPSALVISYIDATTMYYVHNCADWKSQRFYRLGPSTEQLFSITSTSAPAETLSIMEVSMRHHGCNIALLKPDNHLVRNFASVARHN